MQHRTRLVPSWGPRPLRAATPSPSVESALRAAFGLCEPALQNPTDVGARSEIAALELNLDSVALAPVDGIGDVRSVGLGSHDDADTDVEIEHGHLGLCHGRGGCPTRLPHRVS